MQLKCPICQQELNKENRQLRCQNNHCYDIAKDGYINLYQSNTSKIHGDNKTMIQARTSFLEKGYYSLLKNTINELLESLSIQSLVDFACGDGYYTRDFPCQSVIGIDLSKDGCQYASKKDKKNTYVVSSIFDTPLFDKSCDAIITIFAPIADNEIKRVLKDDGYFITVIPAKEHLWQLKQAVYDNPLLHEETLPNCSLTLIKSISCKTEQLLNNDGLQQLFMMTPYFYKTKESDKLKLTTTQHLSCTFDFTILVYKK